jgi:hypothetical protein
MRFNINNKAAVKHTNTLEKLHRSALPLAIRNTLNSVAFDVKKTTMPQEAARTFTQRNPNFFKATSRVEMAKGWNAEAMQSVVGFVGNSQAVEDLEQQEYGGVIEGRSFIPLDPARTGGPASKVRPSNRISRIKNIVNAADMPGATVQAKFMAAVRKAGKGGYVLGNLPKKTLWKIEGFDGRKIKKKALFSFEKSRDVSVSGTGFMRSASIESAEKMDMIFAREAQKQIERLNK